jgi:capsular exopolysaccharide synthesis family protein
LREAQLRSPTEDRAAPTEPRSNVSVEVGNSEYTLSLKDLLRMIRRRALTIVLVAVLLAAAAVGLSLMQPPVYQASTTILVGQEQSDQSLNLASDIMGLQQITMTVVEAVNSRVVAEAVIEELNLDTTPETILGGMAVQQVTDTQFIQIDYVDTNPERAQQIANAIAEVSSEQIAEVSPNATAITATVWEPAVEPTIPISPQPIRNGILAMFLGLGLGVALAFLLESLDDSWRSSEEVEQLSGVSTFGIIPQFKPLRNAHKRKDKKTNSSQNGAMEHLDLEYDPGRNGSNGKNGHHEIEFSGSLVAAADPTGVTAEAYRTLRTNLFYALVDDPPKVIALTSPGPREGKSTTCANLGVMLAQAEKSTLVLDCDLRRPQIHKLFGLRNLRGMSDVLTGRKSLEEAWQEPLPNLKVLTAGLIPPNPAELLGSRRFAELVRQAREKFDYVLIDAPPVELVSDPLILATQSDGVLLVLDAQNTRKVSLRHSMRSLDGVEANVFGTVMNNVDISKKEYRRYQFYSYE